MLGWFVQGCRLCSSTGVSRVWLGMVGLQPIGFREMKLFDFVVMGISPLDFEAIGSEGARGSCRCDHLERSAGILKTVQEQWISLPDL